MTKKRIAPLTAAGLNCSRAWSISAAVLADSFNFSVISTALAFAPSRVKINTCVDHGQPVNQRETTAAGGLACILCFHSDDADDPEVADDLESSDISLLMLSSAPSEIFTAMQYSSWENTRWRVMWFINDAKEVLQQLEG